MAKITRKLVQMVRALRKHLESLTCFDSVKETIARLAAWEEKFYAVQQDALKYLPKALAELDARLAKVLAQTAPKEAHTVAAGVQANTSSAVLPQTQRIRDTPGKAMPPATARPQVATPQPGNHAAHAPPAGPKPKSKRKATGKATPKEPPKDVPDPVLPHDVGPNTKKQAVVDAAAVADRIRIAELSEEARIAGKKGDSALRASKIEEARSILRPHLPKGPNDNWDEVIKRLDVSSPKDGAVFWSGDAEAAQRYAESIGGVTLETTAGGRIIDHWDEVNKGYNWAQWTGPPPHARRLWGEVSKKYAEGASGHIHGVTQTKKLWDEGTLWHNVEKSVLRRSLVTDKITRMSFFDLTNNGKLIPISEKQLDSLLNLKGRSPL